MAFSFPLASSCVSPASWLLPTPSVFSSAVSALGLPPPAHSSLPPPLSMKALAGSSSAALSNLALGFTSPCSGSAFSDSSCLGFHLASSRISSPSWLLPTPLVFSSAVSALVFPPSAHSSLPPPSLMKTLASSSSAAGSSNFSLGFTSPCSGSASSSPDSTPACKVPS